VAAPKKKPAAKKAVAKKPAPKPRAVKKPAPPPPAPPGPPPPPAIDHRALIAALWQRLDAYAASIGAPALGLAPGASERAVAAAEKTMGLAFPPDFRASLLEHDGQTAARVFPWLPGAAPLHPVARIVEAWTAMQKLAAKAKPDKTPPTGKLKPGLARTGRIPIADGTFLDLDPGPEGVRGQIVTQLSKTDLVVVDTGFHPMLDRWVSALERGIWVYDRDQHVVYPKAAPLFRGVAAGLFSKR
jgi:cell wall assembly regulator SMI1